MLILVSLVMSHASVDLFALQKPGLNYLNFIVLLANTYHKTVLWMEWVTEKDEFVFRFDDLLKKMRPITQTKRNLLSVSASIFDPLGFVSPISAKNQNQFLNPIKHSCSFIKQYFVASKTDVTPLKTITIPRLELLGC